MLQPTETSYFSEPAAGLDPRLFRNEKLDSSVRSAILQLLLNHLNGLYTGAEGWSKAYLTGSGVSYQWAANREPGDLDCLITINYPRFRESNPSLRGLSDKEIASEINDGFHRMLHPRTELFLGTFELTFFAIVKPNITDLKPYAAYSLLDDEWVVSPTPTGGAEVPEWEPAISKDKSDAINIISSFISARNKYNSATNDAVKANARTEMRVASSQGTSLYNMLHDNRSLAFSDTGAGYSDFNNYRWQSNKRTGVVNALKSMMREMEARDVEAAASTYSTTEFPDANTLIRRAATYRPN